MQPMEIDIRDSPAMEPEKKLGQIINGQSQPGIIQIKSTKDGFKTPPENDYPSQRSTLQKEARKNWPDKDKEFRIATEDQGEHASIQSQPLYSTFSQSQKYFITAMVTFAAFFSPVSASIYFPILNTLASNLKVTNTLINLTITSYMIFQGLAPMVFGTFADQLGRRPAYIVAFTIYLGANIGLALQDSYVALLLLRCLQSTGSSGTIAIGIGVVSDISTSSERGSYMGMVLGGTMLGPAVGPIIGGLLSHFLGWQAIFWFLVIGSGSFLIVYIIFVSETSREVVGNGSVPPQRWNLSVINWAQLRRQSKIERKNVDVEKRLQKLEPALKGNKSLPNPLQAIYIMLEKDVAIVVLYNALVFAAFYDITASLPMLFKQIYKFNDLQIGLSYLPFGIGCSIASILNGRMLDWNYKRIARANKLPIDKHHGASLQNFPIERARLDILWPVLYPGLLAILGYGWALEASTPLAGPLVLLFLIGLCLTAAINSLSTLLVDMYPQSPATVTAGNNIVRCGLGAGATAVVDLMIGKMGKGWCLTFVVGVCLLFSPILMVEGRYGMRWREERRMRIAVEGAKKGEGE